MNNAYFHLSENSKISELVPRIPIKLWRGHEDDTVRRICFGKKIEDCLKALYAAENTKYTVYIPTFCIGQCQSYRPKPNEVIDADYTGEIWITKPVRVKAIGSIIVNKAEFLKYEPEGDTYIPAYKYEYTFTKGAHK